MVVPRPSKVRLHDEKADRKVVAVGFQVRAAARGRRRRSRDRGGVGGGGGVLGARVDSQRWCHHSFQRIL